MDGQRKALIVANDEYDHEGLRHLLSPAADAEALAGVLGDSQIGGFEVQTVRNQPAHVIQTHVEDLLAESKPDDVLLLHFSCHGLKSESGELFFAARNTRPNRLSSTAISADFVQRCMRASRSRSIVLLLDCCYGGAFGKGVTVRSSGDVNVLDSFPGNRVGGGRGRAVITASSSIEYAFEGELLADDHTERPSVFTTALVEGLATGDADRDEDGWVSLNELYDYVFDRVRAQTPHQTPSRDVEMQGELYLARSRRRRIKPQPIPADLQAAMTDPNMFSRLGAVSELRSRLLSDNLPAAVGAYEALVEIAGTDIQYVAEPAGAAVREAVLHPSETELHFEPVPQGAEQPHRTVRLLGPPVARVCTPHASDSWIHIKETAEGFDISVDTAQAGTANGTINLKGPTGELELAVSISILPKPSEPPLPEDHSTEDSTASLPAAPPDVPASPATQPEQASAPELSVPGATQPQEAAVLDLSLPAATSPEQVLDADTSTLDDAPAARPATPEAARPAAPDQLAIRSTSPIMASGAGKGSELSSASPRPAPPPATKPVAGLPATPGTGGLGTGSAFWALIPVLSAGLLTPAPFVHAAIRLRNGALWVVAAAYALVWLMILLAAGSQPATLLPLLLLLALVGTVHAFALRPRVFGPAAPARTIGERPVTASSDGAVLPIRRTAEVPVPAVPHFRVIALGVAGSGKTVYLSSMFHTVNVPMPGRSYFLETNASHRIYLSKVFDELSDTAEPWPRGTRTGETRELDFDCVSFDEGVKHQVFKISYLDYAGELLESVQEAGSTALSDLEDRIRNAHGLLGMLDGYRVLQYLRNEPAGRRYFRSSIQPMTGMMAGASCPIHFVLTKWDLVRGFGEPDDADDNTRLSLVREALMETAQLKALVDTHTWANRVIRLIPVSAVGPHFAQIDRDGHILKLPDGEVHPTNVEVPLTAILPDLFTQVELSLDASTRKQLAAEARSRRGLDATDSRFSMGSFLSLPAGVALRQKLQDVVGRPAGKEVMGMFLDWMAGVPAEEIRASGRARLEGKRQAMTIEAARARVLAEFGTELAGLEDRLPASRLSGGNGGV